MHPALASGKVAVITGGASGIGLAVARKLRDIGMKVCVADRTALTGVAGAGLVSVETDVSDPAQLRALAERVERDLGPVSFLMNNAGIQPGSSVFDEAGTWNRVLSVNLGGVIAGSQIFAPRMIAHGGPGLIVNTGSKQGITTPPGDPAYNVAKAGVKVFTEALQHHLRNLPDCRVEARLLIPGYVFTALTAKGQEKKPAGAWTPEQTADFMLTSLDRGDFYILCPDNEVDRALDEKRIAWAAGDIIENRPPLSRWHPDFAGAFTASLKAGH